MLLFVCVCVRLYASVRMCLCVCVCCDNFLFSSFILEINTLSFIRPLRQPQTSPNPSPHGTTAHNQHKTHHHHHHHHHKTHNNNNNNHNKGSKCTLIHCIHRLWVLGRHNLRMGRHPLQNRCVCVCVVEFVDLCVNMCVYMITHIIHITHHSHHISSHHTHHTHKYLITLRAHTHKYIHTSTHTC